MDKLDIALNPNTAPETLERLANDESFDVRWRVAYNSNTPPETVDRLANDKNWVIRREVAENPNTALQTLDRLANDDRYEVRYWLTQNPKTPQYIKDYLKIIQFLNCHKDVDIQENLVYSEIQDELDHLIDVQHEATQYEN